MFGKTVGVVGFLRFAVDQRIIDVDPGIVQIEGGARADLDQLTGGKATR